MYVHFNSSDESQTKKSIDILVSVHNCSYYENFLEGEMVMFTHTKLPYAVHAFQRRCQVQASCFCTIAIRSGDDVFVIDTCGSNETPVSRTPQLEVRLYLNNDLAPGTQIEQYNGGKRYKVSTDLVYTLLS